MFPRFYRLPKLCVFSLAILLSLPFGFASADELDDTLRRWVEGNMHFFEDSGNRLLFLRREPVRALVKAHSDDSTEELKVVVRLLSKAMELPVEFTDRDPNLVVLVGSPVSVDDKLNLKLLRAIGLPEPAVEILSETGSWSSGCGFYSFKDTRLQVTLSLALGDNKLMSGSKLDECLTEGIVHAFGFRAQSTNALRKNDGVIQYVLLGRALRFCEKHGRLGIPRPNEIHDLKEKYLFCAVPYLKHRMSDSKG